MIEKHRSTAAGWGSRGTIARSIATKQSQQQEIQMSAPFRIRRRDVGSRAVSRATGDEFKSYLERLMKMIPAEIVGLYLIGSGFIPEDHQRYVLPA